jgi:peroxiredoxin Q/BCP
MRMRTTHTRSLSLVSVLLASVLLTGVAAALEVGDPAPDFTLPSTTGKKISLSQFRGKQNVLLEFFVAVSELEST